MPDGFCRLGTRLDPRIGLDAVQQSGVQEGEVGAVVGSKLRLEQGTRGERRWGCHLLRDWIGRAG